MRVIMKVLDVEITGIKNNTQQLGKVTMKSPGSDAVTVMMFNKDIEDGKAAHLDELCGRMIVTDIEVDVREGSISYRFGFNSQIMPYEAFVQNAAQKLSKAPAPVTSPTPAQTSKAS